jgi:hypothetical protein
MIKRPMTRLAIAAAAAGTMCAFGISAASAAPTTGWAGHSVVPGAITNDTATTSSISFPGGHAEGKIVAWRQKVTPGHIFYKIKVPGKKWSAKVELPGATAITGTAPVFRSYKDPHGRNAVVAVWTGRLDHHIWFEQGETLANGTINWNKAAVLPSKVLYTDTTNAPAVLFLNHAYRVVFSWRGPANHVRFSVGRPNERGFVWSKSRIVPGAPVGTGCVGAPCTSSTPAVAEVQNSATTGTVYFFWRQLSTNDVLYSTAPDASFLTAPTWTGPTTDTGVTTDASPAAADSTLSGFGPLLLVTKVAGQTNVDYQTLTGMTWTAPVQVLATHTTVAPSLFINRLSTTTPGADGNILLQNFSN